MKRETEPQTEEIQRIIKSYFKSLYSTKPENLNEIDDFLDRYHLPNLKSRSENYLNSPITLKEIEVVMKSLPTKKNPRARWL